MPFMPMIDHATFVYDLHAQDVAWLRLFVCLFEPFNPQNLTFARQFSGDFCPVQGILGHCLKQSPFRVKGYRFSGISDMPYRLVLGARSNRADPDQHAIDDRFSGFFGECTHVIIIPHRIKAFHPPKSKTPLYRTQVIDIANAADRQYRYLKGSFE